MVKKFLIPVLFVFLSLSGCSPKLGSSASDIIFVCGDDKVQMIDLSKSNGEQVAIMWQWAAKEATDIPAAYQKMLATLDECKPFEKNTKLMLTSSGGATVVLDIKTKKVFFYAKTPMAHSAEILPNNRIVVANSTHSKGNSIELYDINKPEKVICKDSLYSGHGVVWNKKNKKLYALGYDELREYTLQNWESDSPALELNRYWKLPDEGGHDLFLYNDGV